MKKVIKKADIKAMSLTDDELLFIENDFDDLNKNGMYNTSVRFYFDSDYYRSSCNQDKRNAYRKAILYFAKKFIIENGGYTQVSLRCVSRYIANIFETYPDAITSLLKGFAYNDKRIYITDTFGLDVFQYDFK